MAGSDWLTCPASASYRLTWPLETMMLTRVVFNARRDEPDCLRFDAEAQSKAVRVDVEFGVA